MAGGISQCLYVPCPRCRLAGVVIVGRFLFGFPGKSFGGRGCGHSGVLWVGSSSVQSHRWSQGLVMVTSEFFPNEQLFFYFFYRD